MPYSRKHKEQTKQRIINCAQKLFKTHGYKNVSIDQIMAEANLTRGGFYAHFKSKKSLVTACLQSSDGRQFLMALMPTGKADTYETCIEKLLTGYLSVHHRDNPAIGCPVAALGNSAEHVGGDASSAYASLVEGMASSLQSKLLTTMPVDQIYAVISQAVGCLNMARATIERPDLSLKILVSGQNALKRFILINSKH